MSRFPDKPQKGANCSGVPRVRSPMVGQTATIKPPDCDESGG
ncbi:hypothetical protein [Phormidium sp. CCY1219]|nr:hypothetical protein [Phormidium sp. CCY1219]